MLPAVMVLAGALALGLLALHRSVRYFRVSSGSMQPTLAIGERVAAERSLPLADGEIVFFRAPQGALPASPVCGVAGEGLGTPAPCAAAGALSEVVLVKRIVAGPGDLVAVRGGHAVINGAMREEPFASGCAAQPGCDFPVPVRVPAGSFYVLGDNRGASDDSRFWGAVPASAILGVAVRCGPLQTGCQPLR